MRKRGPDRAPSWWWQYKAQPVAGLSQSVSGTYTFKVRVLEGITHPRPIRVPLHEEDRRWASRGLRSSLDLRRKNRSPASTLEPPPVPEVVNGYTATLPPHPGIGFLLSLPVRQRF